jgi:hypothetical protein
VTETAVTFDDYVYETIKLCSTALGQTMTEWLNNAARDAARRQNAQAYAAWLMESRVQEEMGPADAVTSEISLAGSEW